MKSLSGRGLLVLLAIDHHGGMAFASDVVAAIGGRVSFQAVYNMLHRLVDAGYIVGELEPERRHIVGGQRRTHYTVTGAGRVAMDEALGLIDRLREKKEAVGNGL